MTQPVTHFLQARAEAPRLARWPVLGALLSLASCFALSGTAGPASAVQSAMPSSSVQLALGTDVEPAVMTFQPVEADEAVALNAAVPNFAGPILAASPFKAEMALANIGTRMSALECLTSAIYYEAASESAAGQRAVAQVVLNRVRHPAYPNTVCGVVFQGAERTTGCQFTFTCDGSLARQRHPVLWARATAIAAAAMSGYVERAVGTATHYHTIWVVPYWQSSLTKVTTLGAHIFYRWAGSWGQPSAFTDQYTGAEVLPAKLAMLGEVSAEQDLMAAYEADGMTSTDYAASLPAFGPATAHLQMPSRPSLSADSGQGKLLVDESRGVLLKN